jgi:nitrate reductase NapE component
MFRPETDSDLNSAASAGHEELDPLVIRWMPVIVPLGAVAFLGLGFIVWSTVL